MHPASSNHIAQSNRNGTSLMSLLLLGCVSVLLLGFLLLGLHALNTGNRGIPYTLEAGASLPEASELCGVPNAAYPKEMPDHSSPGEYTLVLSTPKGRRTVFLTVVDTTPPVIEGVADITVYVGESVAYRKNITLTDNAGNEEITLSVDSAAVNTAEEGAYTVIYSATDKAGNTASKTASVYVKTDRKSLDY